MSKLRKFKGGAVRDLEGDKIDYHGFYSPEVMERFGQYMHGHRQTAEGLRSSSNWKKGIDQESYIKSLIRHTVDFWKEPSEELACAILFNAQGWLFEELKKKK